MALTGAGRVWAQTTAGALSTVVVCIESIHWVGGNTIGHTCEVTATTGNVIFTAISNSTTYTDAWVYDRLWANSPTVSTIDSGSCYMVLSAR